MRTISWVSASPLLVILTAGCSHTFGLDRQKTGARVSPDSAVYVALPEPGRFDETIYSKSGQQTGEALVRGYSRHVQSATLASVVETTEVALESARSNRDDYLVHAVIEHWEERATEWSGIPDRIAVLVRLYDVETGRMEDASKVTGKSRWATFGGDHPEELLEPALEPYFEALFPPD